MRSVLKRREFNHMMSSALLWGLLPQPLVMNTKAPKWHPAASLPYRIQEIYCGRLNSKFHVAGGFIIENGPMGVSDHHIAYDPASDSWTELAAIPESRHHLALCGYNNKLYAFGGFVAESRQATWIMQQQTWIYDPSDDTWTTARAAPRPHGETVSANLGGLIHFVGGRTPKKSRNQEYRDHIDTASHMVYDPSADSWSEAAPALKPRNSAAGAIIDGLWYVAGGRNVGFGNTSDLEVYDASDDKWRSAAPMPQAQGGLAAASAKGKLYAFGGEFFDNGGGVYKECWVYDPNRDAWEESAPMLSPRHGLAGISLDDRIFAIGGALRAGAAETSNLVEVLHLD